MKLILAAFLTLPALAQMTPQTREAIDQAVTKIVAKSGIASASIAIVQDGKLAYAQAYGFADLETKKPATPAMRLQDRFQQQTDHRDRHSAAE
jgi:CubicO group peptidase (beta-lactamase class C family)